MIEQQDMFRIEKIIAESDAVCEYVLGSCHSLQEVGTAFPELSRREIEHILEEADIHCCECCSWWCQDDISDNGDAWVCNDCAGVEE